MKIETRLLTHLTVLAAFLLLWEWLARSGAVSGFYTGAPSAIFSALLEHFRSGLFARHGARSLGNLAIGYPLALVCGALAGVVIGYYKPLYRNLRFYLQAFYTVPQLVLIPFFILWLGVENASKITIIFLMAFFPVLISAMEAAKAVDPELVNVCRVYGAGRLMTLSRLVLPACAPQIAAGAKIGAVRAVAGLILGEAFGRAEGLGYLLFHFGAVYSVNDMMAVLVVIMAAGLSLFFSLNFAERKILTWK